MGAQSFSDDDLAIAGQITLDQLQQIADDDYKSVLNLHWQHKKSLLVNEKEKTEFLGLRYVNFPIKAKHINHQAMLWILKTITELPKQTLISSKTKLITQIST